MSNKELLGWIIGIVAAFLIAGSLYIVQPGKAGAIVTLGKVSEKSVANGLGVKWPLISKVKRFDVKQVKIETMTETYTEDIQTAEITYAFTYNLRPAGVNILYQAVGYSYEEKLIIPIVTDVIKDVIGKYQAQRLISERENARNEILSSLRARLNADFFENFGFQITSIDYSDTFEKAIEAKVTAEQKALEAKNRTVEVEEQAKQKVISAEAEAKAMAIRAEALEKNPKLTEYEAVQKWDGQLPTYMMGNSVPFVNLK